MLSKKKNIYRCAMFSDRPTELIKHSISLFVDYSVSIPVVSSENPSETPSLPGWFYPPESSTCLSVVQWSY